MVNKSVTMGKVISTKKAGIQKLMELEEKFKKMLASVNGFEVKGNSLKLISNGEVVATFQTE